MKEYIPKVGDVIEVWVRETPRHKYRMEFSFVQVIRVIKEEDPEIGLHYHLSVKTSSSFTDNGFGGYEGATSFQTKGMDRWVRKFVKVGHLPVKTAKFEFKKKK